MPTEEGRTHALALLLSFVGGWCISIQSRMNGELSAVLGQPVQAAVYSFGSGLVLLALGALLSTRVRAGARRIATALRAGRLRWWQCLGGFGGAIFVAVQTLSVPLVGVAVFTVSVVAGQTANGLLVDRLGVGPGGRRAVLPSRVLAAVLAVVGVAVTVSDSLDASSGALLPVLLAVVAGAGVALQQAVNGRVTAESRDVVSTTAQNFATGTTLLLALFVLEWAFGRASLVPFADVPWWAWWGGFIGIAFIAVAAWAVQHLGVLVFGLALLSGQLLSALAIDLLVPAPGSEITAVMIAGVAITFTAAALAGWFARPRRDRAVGATPVKG